MDDSYKIPIQPKRTVDAEYIRADIVAELIEALESADAFFNLGTAGYSIHYDSRRIATAKKVRDAIAKAKAKGA